MPGRFFLTTPPDEIAALLGTDAAGFDDEPPRRNVAPGQEIVICPPDRRLTRMRWGMIPVGRVNARGRPVMETIVNARSETVFSKTAFKGVRRCIAPADGWYEWTGERRHKTAWRIRPRDGGLLLFAAIYDIWEGPGGVRLPQAVTVTCPPSGDVRDIHDRMGVILTPEGAGVWLDGTEAEAADLMVPFPDGSLMVEEAVDVDWSAA